MRPLLKKPKTFAEFSQKNTGGSISGMPKDAIAAQNEQKAQSLAKMGDYAPGLPDRSIKRSIPRITEPRNAIFAIQRHIADKAGDHKDLRLVIDGVAYSWATRHLPENPGDKVLAVRQPDHSEEYATTFEGTIPSGYGAGTVKIFSNDKVEIIKSDLDHIVFNRYLSNGGTERYALIRTNGDQYLFSNTTPTRKSRPFIPSSKPSYKSADISKVDVNNPNQVFAPKIDGALNAFLLRKGKNIEAYSYRPSVKANDLIDHTYRLPHYKTPSPMNLSGNTVVLGEVFAADQEGNALPAVDTTARLLSNVWRSRDLQKKAPLQTRIFNILTYKGRDVSQKPYREKLEMLKGIAKSVPNMQLPPLAVTPEQKADLLQKVRSGNHPLSREGIAIYNLDEHTPTKAKVQEDYDVHIREITEGERGLTGKAAGGFAFSYTPDGPIAGRVGSGFDLATRIDMKNHPEKYVGQVARVWAQQQLPSGALRMPVFKDLRPELWKSAAVTLTPYQEELKARLKNQHGLVVGFPTGSGKTIGSLAAMDEHGPTSVVTPASLRENFKKEIKTFKPKSKFDVQSYESVMKRPETVSGKNLIFDEAHAMRTGSSKRSQVSQYLAQRANKVLLLSATPMMNRPSDIATPINMAAGKYILPPEEKDFNARYVQHTVDRPGALRRMFGAKAKDEYHAKNLDDFKARAKPYYMGYTSGKDKSMPDVHEQTVDVEMSPSQINLYRSYERKLPGNVHRSIQAETSVGRKDSSKLNAFLSATRQVSNVEDTNYSPKFHAIVKNIVKSPGQSLVYSNFLKSGVNPLSELLTKAKVKNSVYTGKMNDAEKKKVVTDYNSGKIRSLIVSGAGGHGISLLKTRSVHLANPNWNMSSTSQVIGRSARINSHTMLPKDQRNVSVYKYRSVLPEQRHGFLWLKKDRPVSTDQYLDALSRRKESLNKEFMDVLK